MNNAIQFRGSEHDFVLTSFSFMTKAAQAAGYSSALKRGLRQDTVCGNVKHCGFSGVDLSQCNDRLNFWRTKFKPAM